MGIRGYKVFQHSLEHSFDITLTHFLYRHVEFQQATVLSLGIYNYFSPYEVTYGWWFSFEL